MLLSTVGIYAAVIVFTRIVGLRSFAKMSSFDFAMTVAVGSLMATTIVLKEPPLLQAILALGCLYALQMFIAYLRSKSFPFINIIDNQPLLLMKGDLMIEENMKKALITHDDLLEKLREANVTDFSHIKAVIFETTGDVSVLHDHDPTHELDFKVIENVVAAQQIKKHEQK